MFWALWLEVVWGKDNSWSGTLQGQRECNNLTSASFQTIKKKQNKPPTQNPKKHTPSTLHAIDIPKGTKKPECDEDN